MARTSRIQFNEEIVSFRKTSYHVIHVITTESDANKFACGSFFVFSAQIIRRISVKIIENVNI